MDKTLSAIVACLVAAAVLAVLVFGGLFLSERRKAQEARSEGKVATGQATAAKGAIDVQAGVTGQTNAIQNDTRSNQEDIRNADNYSQSAGEAGDRLLRAQCQRVRYQSDPRCAGLR